MFGLSVIVFSKKKDILNIQKLISEINSLLVLCDTNIEIIIVGYPKENRNYFDLKTKFCSSFAEAFTKTNYNHITVIDATRLYPFRYIPEMLQMINPQGVDVVATTFSSKKFHSKLINILYKDFDPKLNYSFVVFNKEILERIPKFILKSSFTIINFLNKSKAAGYKIGFLNINYDEEIKLSPLTYLQAFLEILRIKLNSDEKVILFHINQRKQKGYGFHYNGSEFVNHTSLNCKESALVRLMFHQKILIFSIILAFAAGFYISWIQTIKVLVICLTLLYFSDLLFNFFLVFRSIFCHPEIKVSKKETQVLQELPVYTIFCPLYKEWEVLPQFVNAIKNIDYPKKKLQVLLLLEEDDKTTIEHAHNMELPDFFEIVIVPHSMPKTKPKACNYGLLKAKGEYCVIYDAEDIPDPLQLKKAVVAFNRVSSKVVCIQAKLNFYNPFQNLLSKLFTAEYSLWFDLILPGLQSLDAPIPLGGTSNHFKTKFLRQVQGWDAFNVTEDCDLGIRLYKRGHLTALLDSTTYEEANVSIKNWIPQRTRWVKGYIQSYFVHVRKPKEFLHGWNNYHLLTFHLVVGGKTLSMFINPFMWCLTFLYFFSRSTFAPFIEMFFPPLVLYLGVFSLIVGNFLYMYEYMVGCAKRGYYRLIKYVFIVPFYWLFMSYAAWHALYEIIVKPHYWAKTKHGLHLQKVKDAAISIVNNN